MTDCKCLECDERFACDFALSAWAAKSRMKHKGVLIKFKTYYCTMNDLAETRK